MVEHQQVGQLRRQMEIGKEGSHHGVGLEVLDVYGLENARIRHEALEQQRHAALHLAPATDEQDRSASGGRVVGVLEEERGLATSLRPDDHRQVRLVAEILRCILDHDGEFRVVRVLEKAKYFEGHDAIYQAI